MPTVRLTLLITLAITASVSWWTVLFQPTSHTATAFNTRSFPAPKRFFTTLKSFQIDSRLCENGNPAYPALPHIWSDLRCDRVKASHLAFALGKPVQSSDPSESDSRRAERGWEARHRLVILLAKWGPPAGRLPLPLPPPHLCPPAALTGHPVQEQKSHLVFVWDSSQAEWNVYLCVSNDACMNVCINVCMCVCLINTPKLAFASDVP